jgi:hypothetical protein
MGLAQEEVPKAELASLDFEFLDDGDDRLPSRRAMRKLSPGQPLSRPDVLLYNWYSYGLRRQSLLNMFTDLNESD